MSVLPPGLAVSLAMYFIKKWMSDIDWKLKDTAQAIVAMQKEMAHQKGKSEGEKESIWMKLETNARKTEKLLNSNEKIWQALSKISHMNDRTSDRILRDD